MVSHKIPQGGYPFLRGLLTYGVAFVAIKSMATAMMKHPTTIAMD